VNVHLLVDTKHNVTIVPVAAIQRGPQGTYVYTAGPGNAAKIQAVTISQTTGNLVGLSAGINPGENVVIDGQDKLQDGTKINPTQTPMPAPTAAVAAPHASSPTASRPTALGNTPSQAAGKTSGATPR
jgi:multidrug efflux system membrane fusion protein